MKEAVPKFVFLGCQVTPAMAESVQKLRKCTGISTSEVMRRALALYLKREEPKRERTRWTK